MIKENMKKILIALMLCLVSIMSFGQTYSKIDRIKELAIGDTIILYCEELNATLDTFVVDSTNGYDCYGLATQIECDKSNAMHFIVVEANTQTIKINTVDGKRVYGGYNARPVWKGIGTYCPFDVKSDLSMGGGTICFGTTTLKAKTDNNGLVYFCDSGKALSDLGKNIKVYKKETKDIPTSIYNADYKSVYKFIDENGRIVIDKNGVRYTVQGARL